MKIERNPSVLKTDVLVIGGGAAALRAAIAAHDAGAEVLMVSKGAVGKSGATYVSMAELGGFNVPDGALDPTDNPEVFYQDILTAALGEADPEVARLVAYESIDAKNYLEECGLQLKRHPDGSYMGFLSCFSSKARTHIVENHFKPVTAVLGRKITEAGIPCLENAVVTNLLVEDGVCRGAFVLMDGKLCCIRAAGVIMAVGGASMIFAHNMYPEDITGDGYAMGHRAGARITNMEFVQSGLGFAKPYVNLFGNQLWEARPRLTNGKGERFMEKYIDEEGVTEADVTTAKVRHFPFSSRGISRFVEISVQREIYEGTPTESGNIYLDFQETDFEALFSKPNSQLAPMWPMTYDRFKNWGIDLYKDKVEIACFAHAINGGIRIDVNAESTIPGLYAAGEVASGPHGADRLGGNMIITTQIFGRRAGEAAAKRAKADPAAAEVSEAAFAAEVAFLDDLGMLNKADADALVKELQRASDEALLIVRSEEKLARYMDILDELEGRLGKNEPCEDPVGLQRMLEIKNLLTSARLIATAARARKECRGSHYRTDYPHIVR